MSQTQFLSITLVDSLKETTLKMTNNDVDRESYLQIFNSIKSSFGTDSAAIFRDNVKGENGQFWIDSEDYGYMWKRILKDAKTNN